MADMPASDKQKRLIIFNVSIFVEFAVCFCYSFITKICGPRIGFPVTMKAIQKANE